MGRTVYEGRLGAVTLASNGLGNGLRAELLFGGNDYVTTDEPAELRALAAALLEAARAMDGGAGLPRCEYDATHFCCYCELCDTCGAVVRAGIAPRGPSDA